MDVTLGATGASARWRATSASRISLSNATCSLMRRYQRSNARPAMNTKSGTTNKISVPSLMPPVYATTMDRGAD